MELRLKSIREDRDVTQKEISDYLHIKQNTYSQYENGQRQIPLETLVRFCEYFGVSSDYVLGITDISIPYQKFRR